MNNPIKGLLVLDADSTLFNEEAIDLLAVTAGVSLEVSKITERAMRGDIDFETALKERVRLLKGLKAEALIEVERRLTLTNGALELIQQARESKWKIAILSGGFMEILQPIMTRLEIDLYRANNLEIVDSVLTGEVTGEILDRSLKAKLLREFAASLDVELERTIAVGDGANDIEMVKSAGIGIAFCAKPILKEFADVVIDDRDLRLILQYL